MAQGWGGPRTPLLPPRPPAEECQGKSWGGSGWMGISAPPFLSPAQSLPRSPCSRTLSLLRPSVCPCPMEGVATPALLLAAAWLCWVLGPAGAQDSLCYEKFDAGSCQDLLGEGVAQEDCCLNPAYGYQPRPGAPCQSCRAAEWSAWTPWSPCSVSCREGVQRRSQTCQGQGPCQGAERRKWETQACSLNDCCPVMGGWSAWGPWSSCSVTCAQGVKRRVRSCTEPVPDCGGLCPGHDSESLPCDTYKICPTHGNWGSWEEWGPCAATCSPEGAEQKPTQKRWRVCNNPAPSHIPPGFPCSGTSNEDRPCPGLPYCPVDGSWSNWKPSSPCSVTCGVGRRTEERLCNNPAPQHGGKACPGLDTRTQFCSTKIPCPVDGQWSEWEKWSECLRPGFSGDIRCQEIVGQQKRMRTCKGRAHGGNRCEGSYIEFRSCYNMNRCFVEGQWSDWSSWGLCMPACGENPMKSRKRVCEPTYPKFSMTTQGVGSTKLVNVSFWGTPYPKCEAINGQKKEVVERKPCLNVQPCSEEEDG